MGTFLDRYRAGEREEVWAELVAIGSGVRDPSVLPDALTVAHETMARVAANVDSLIERLTEMGYWFRSEGAKLRASPESSFPAEIEQLKADLLPI